MRTLQDWMTPNPVTVPLDATLRACADIMSRDGFRHLPTVDRAGRLHGVISDVSLIELGLFGDRAGGGEEEAELPAYFVSLSPEVVARPHAPLLPVLNRLTGSLDDVAIAVDGEGRPVGLFSEHDAARLAAQRLRTSMDTSWTRRRRLVAVKAGHPASTARALMSAARLRHVLVMNGEELMGVLSMRDLAAAGALDSATARARAGDLVRQAPVTVPVGTLLREVARLMCDQSIGCLPVMDGAEVERVITRSDITRALAASLEEEIFFTAEEARSFAAMSG